MTVNDLTRELQALAEAGHGDAAVESHRYDETGCYTVDADRVTLESGKTGNPGTVLIN